MKGVWSVENFILVMSGCSDLTGDLQIFEFRLSPHRFCHVLMQQNSRFSWKLAVKRSLDISVVYTILGNAQYAAILFQSQSYKLKTCWKPTVSLRSTFCRTR